MPEVVAKDKEWSGFFSNLKMIVSRAQEVVTLNFPNTLAQTSSDLAVPFSEGTVDLDDIALVAPPAASVLSNSCYTAHIVNVDEVVVRFNNYSAVAKNPASGDFVVTVIKK